MDEKRGIKCCYGFFFVSRPRTLIPYLIGLFFISLIYYVGIFQLFFQGEDKIIFSDYTVYEIIAGFIAFIGLGFMGCLDKLIIFSLWYALLLIYMFLFKQNKNLKIKDINLQEIEKPLKRFIFIIQYIFLPIELLTLGSLYHKEAAVLFMVLFFPMFGAAIILANIIEKYFIMKLISLGIAKNKKFALKNMYEDVRTLLTSTEIVISKESYEI